LNILQVQGAQIFGLANKVIAVYDNMNGHGWGQ
jgi:hypothetical protein